MGSEIAFINQALNKIVKTVSTETEVLRVPVHAGDSDIKEGDRLSIDNAGNVSPSTVLSVTGAKTANLDASSEPKHPTHTGGYCAVENDCIIQVEGNANNTTSIGVTMQRVNTTTNMMERLKDLTIDTSMIAVASASICQIKPGMVAVKTYQTAITNYQVYIISYNASTPAMSVVSSSNQVGVSTNSGSIARVNNNLVCVAVDAHELEYFKVTDAGVIDKTMTARPMVSLSASYHNIYSMRDNIICSVDNLSNVRMIKIDPETLELLNVTSDCAGEEKFKDHNYSVYSVQQSNYTAHSGNSRLKQDGEIIFFSQAITPPTDQYHTIRLTVADDCTYVAELFTPSAIRGWQSNGSLSLIPIGNNVYVLFDSGSGTVQSYNPNTYRVTFNTDRMEYLFETMHMEHWSDGTTSQARDTDVLFQRADGSVVSSTIQNDYKRWTFTFSADGEMYPQVQMRALSDIAAGTDGYAISHGTAFYAPTATPGSSFLEDYMVTNTNYAISRGK